MKVMGVNAAYGHELRAPSMGLGGCGCHSVTFPNQARHSGNSLMAILVTFTERFKPGRRAGKGRVMSSYFDNLSRKVSEVPREPSDSFITAVAAIERSMIDDVVLVAGDREFPPLLRESIMSAIAKWHVGTYAGLEPTPKAKEYALSLCMSELVEHMHDIFHQVARLRAVTRFGMLSDNPKDILNRRDDHDSPDPEASK